MDQPRWALVTGASSGLGVEYVRALARGGHNIVLVARNQDRLQTLAQEVERDFSVATEVMAADLHASRAVVRVAKRLSDASRPIRVLVNNAGYGIGGDLAKSDPGVELNHLAIHITVPLELTRAALPGCWSEEKAE